MLASYIVLISIYQVSTLSGESGDYLMIVMRLRRDKKTLGDNQLAIYDNDDNIIFRVDAERRVKVKAICAQCLTNL